MTQAGLPVSTTQGIVGAILGWNLWSHTATDVGALSKIAGAWVASPILGALFAWLLYRLVRVTLRILKPHMLQLDQFLRTGFVLAGILGAYSLGANNIANVVGVFVPSASLSVIDLGPLTLSGEQRLFAMGGIAIAVGALFSRPVMMTVGKNLMPLNPIGGLVVVMAQALVLFIFSSTALQGLLVRIGLPPIPLVPVSSSQAVVGAVVGVSLAHGFRGMRQIQLSVLRNIAVGWVLTPTIAAGISYIALYIVQNVFEQTVFVGG
jgi:PiT family inorganic phosphate transporter